MSGKKIANQTGSSIGNIFVDQIAPKAGLHKGDYQEIRMNVNDMVAAMAAKTVDAMVNVEPYNAIAEAEGLANTLVDFYALRQAAGVHGGDAGIRRQESATPWCAYLKAWLEVAKDFKDHHEKVVRRDLFVLHLEGLQDVEGHLRQGAGPRRGRSRLAGRSRSLHAHHAEVLLKAKKIKTMPDWSKAFRKDFMKKAEA